MRKNQQFWKILLIIGIFLFIGVLISIPFIYNNSNADLNESENYYPMMNGIGMMGFMMIIPTICLLLVIYAAMKYYEANRRNNDDALNLLKRRFANGEISKDEFLERKRFLENDQ